MLPVETLCRPTIRISLTRNSSKALICMLISKDKKFIRTFASYEEGDELFSDRNIFPRGCVVKMEKVLL